MVATDSHGPCHENPFILNVWARADTLWWNGNTFTTIVWFFGGRVTGIHADTITKVLGFASTRGKKYVARFGRDLGALWTAAVLAWNSNCTLTTAMYRSVLLFITQLHCQGLLCWWLGNPRSHESCISLLETGARRISPLAAVHDCSVTLFDVPMTGSLRLWLCTCHRRASASTLMRCRWARIVCFFHSFACTKPHPCHAKRICTRSATLGHKLHWHSGEAKWPRAWLVWLLPFINCRMYAEDGGDVTIAIASTLKEGGEENDRKSMRKEKGGSRSTVMSCELWHGMTKKSKKG